MSRSSVERLEDARSYALHALANAGGLSADVLAEAAQPLHAALYDLVIIGEALSKIPKDVQSLAPEIPWRAITGLRNYVVHSYWRVDLELVADIVERRLEPLILSLERLTENLRRTEG